ncbi:Na+/H+-dicarboxylate symporter [Methylohalomonas lacus]|uniref:Na+/H+-dicarboxylate symporter n=1 Tax=Methylohalomonas lacus TaxID=398773 RepID=A0AAE3HKW4_9GAMM|nr:dicarboxylate/amino acid:cation symporter [Methylohalomonas lacus]MCS3902999.1 Na+/H+-dicarboxylate symporter [Methylohalomonas lacus]
MPQFRQQTLLWAILVGAAAGLVCGWWFGEAMAPVAWLGDLFLDALKMVIVPLIVAAVISGIGSLGDVRRLGRIGGLTLLYYLLTTASAVLLGLVLVNLVQPGSGIDTLAGGVPEGFADKETTGFSDIVRSLISPNLVAAAADTQLLPIIVFSLLLGAALTTVGEHGRTTLAFFDGLNEAMMKLVMWIMVAAPVGIFALIAGRFAEAGGGAAFLAEVQAVGWYVATVIGGLFLHFLLLTAVGQALARRGFSYVRAQGRALVTAFGTGTSSGTLPVTMECAREAGVDDRAVRFVLPLGATVNMDGTALYEAVAVMFIAQAYGIELGLAEQTLVFITATLAAIGAAGIPQAGLVTMIIVLTAVNLPLEGIGLLLAVDWFLDRLRTLVNVWGDSVGAAVIGQYIGANDAAAAPAAPQPNA